MNERPVGHQLSPLDAAFLYIETDEGPLHIGGVSILEGEVTAEALVSRLEARLHEAPRYLQRIGPAPLALGHPAWEADPAFDIARHVTEHVLEAPGDDTQLRSLAARLFARRLDRGKPLWELHVVRGIAGGRSALVSKIHHCMVDGISGVELMDLLFDTTPEGEASPPRQPERQPSGPGAAQEPTGRSAGGLLETIRAVAAGGLETGAGLLGGIASFPEGWRHALNQVVDSTTALTSAALRSVIRLPFNRPLTGERRLGWTTLPLDEVRAIGQRRGATVNDVALAVLTDGIGRWLAAEGVETRSRYLRLLVPVNVRRPDERGQLGNRVSMIPVEVPFEAAPLDRLDCTVAHTSAMKRAGVADLLERATELGDLFPAPLFATVLSLAASARLLAWSAPLRSAPFLTANLVCTNVPGPRVPLFGFGHRLAAHYPLVPLAFETGLNCALLTYNHTLHVGLVADAGAIDDPDVVVARLLEAYADLRAAAGIDTRPSRGSDEPSSSSAPALQEPHAPTPETIGADATATAGAVAPRPPRRRSRRRNPSDTTSGR